MTLTKLHIYSLSLRINMVCVNQNVFYAVYYWLPRAKPLKFKRRLGKTVNFLFGPCLINTFYVLLDLCNYWSF